MTGTAGAFPMERTLPVRIADQLHFDHEKKLSVVRGQSVAPARFPALRLFKYRSTGERVLRYLTEGQTEN